MALFFEGYHGTRQRGLIGFTFGFLSQITLFLMVWTFNILYLVVHNEVSSDISILEVVVLNTAVVIRNIIIAVKYAYFSKRDLEKRKKKYLGSTRELFENQIITGSFFLTFIIIAGWMFPGEESILRQLQISSIQNGIDLHEMKFSVSNSSKDEVDIP